MRYEIERKTFGEANYSKVAVISAQPNTDVLANHSYQADDSLLNAQAGAISYRIREIVDTTTANFTAAYIDTVDLTLGSSCITTGVSPVNPNQSKITIIPNPAHQQLTLRVETLNAISHLNVRILDMKGGQVLQFTLSKGPGAQNFSLPVYRLAKGKYTIALYDGDHFLSSKELILL